MIFVLRDWAVYFSATRMRPTFHWLVHKSRSSFLAEGPSTLRYHNQHYHSPRTQTHNSMMLSVLNNSKDPVERTASPYQSPYHQSPKSKILSERKGSKFIITGTILGTTNATDLLFLADFHSTSLKMVSQTVNKVILSLCLDLVAGANLSRLPFTQVVSSTLPSRRSPVRRTRLTHSQTPRRAYRT